MSLKLSPGCKCCGCSACSNATWKEEYDVTLSGLSDGTLCEYCEVLNGTFSLAKELEVFRPETGWEYSWNHAGYGHPDCAAADAVADATSACVWNYGTSMSSLDCLNFGPYPISERWFWMEGLTLAKFKISDVSYIWRLIVTAPLIVTCQFSTSEMEFGGWYWERTSTTKDCDLDGTEIWTPYTPSGSVTIECDDGPYTLNRSDFCTGIFSLESVVDG